MDTLLHVGLSNAIAASVLAVLAAAVGFVCRRPAVRHALWLLVLLKLVTPPLIDVPIWRAPPAEQALAFDLPPAPDEEPLEDAPEFVALPAEEGPAAAVEEEADRAEEPAPLPPLPEEPALPTAIVWQPLAAAVWLGGSALWLLLAGLRAWRFARLLRFAKPAPAWLQREAGDLAARLGLLAAPDLRLLPGRVSPMLWAPGWRTLLLLPAELLGRLDATGRRTLLAHELAHLRRGDHRVRLFELLVTALFWWHPIVWWARRELHEAEEQCCDAWVLFALPESAKSYALALVETVDFLSEAPAPLPALASGMGHVHDLRRRVTMIMQGTTPRALTWGGVLGLLGLGTFLLPVAPSWAQEEQPGDQIRLQLVKPGDAPPKVTDDLMQLKADLEKKRAELVRAEAMLKAAQERLGKAAAAVERTTKRRVIVLELFDGDGKQIIKLPPGSRVIGDQLPAKGEQLKIDARVVEVAKERDVLAEIAELKKKMAAAQAAGAAPQQRVIIEIISDGKRQVIELPAGSRVISGQAGDDVRVRVQRGTGDNKTPPPGAMPPKIDMRPGQAIYGVVPKAPADTEKRVADLEKRLEELMRAVKELHGELNRVKPPMAPPPPPPARIRSLPPQEGSTDPFLPVPPTPRQAK